MKIKRFKIPFKDTLVNETRLYVLYLLCLSFYETNALFKGNLFVHDTIYISCNFRNLWVSERIVFEECFDRQNEFQNENRMYTNAR